MGHLDCSGADAKLDPRVRVGTDELQKQLALARKVTDVLAEVVQTYHAIEPILKARKKEHASEALTDSLAVLTTKGKPSLSSVAGVLTNLVSAVQSADAAPTQGQREVLAQYRKQYDALLQRWQVLSPGVQHPGSK